MFDSPIIDVIITLSFIYFLLALIVSAAKEMISTVIGWRSKLLHDALKYYLDKEWETKVFPKIKSSPFVTMLQRSIPDGKNDVKDSFPSYIHSSQFYQSLMTAVQGNSSEPLTLANLRKRLEGLTPDEWIKTHYPHIDPSVVPEDIQNEIKTNIIDGKVVPFIGQTRTMLLTMIDQAEGSIDKFQKSVEKSFDESMERVSGWYKRKTRFWLFLISCGITVVLNVDTINIASTLWKDPARAKRTADAAIKASKNFEYDKSGNAISIKSYTTPSGAVTNFVLGDTVKAHQKSMDSLRREVRDSLKKLDSIFRRASEASATLQSLDVPMGWSEAPLAYSKGEKGDVLHDSVNVAFDWDHVPPRKDDNGHLVSSISECSSFRLWIFRLAGWLITAMAISMGAPFWFDLFNKVVNLRGSGGKPSKSKEK